MLSSASTWRWYEIGPGADLSRRGELRLGAGVQGRAQGCTGQGQGDAMRCLPQPGLHPDELALPRQGGLDGVGEQDDQRLRRADPEGGRRHDRHLPRRELRQAARTLSFFAISLIVGLLAAFSIIFAAIFSCAIAGVAMTPATRNAGTNSPASTLANLLMVYPATRAYRSRRASCANAPPRVRGRAIPES